MKNLLTLFALCTVFVASAQWTNDTDVNTLVADSEGLDMQSLGTSDGKTYVVFWKNVGAPVNIELRLQIIDADGNQTLGSDGNLISNTIPMSTSTAIWKMTVDDNDDLYVGVTGTGSGNPAYVFKMDASGNHLWDANGVNIGNGNLVTILPLSNGGAIVSWLDSGGALMQKLDTNGDPVWPSDQPIVQGGDFTAPANLFELTGGEYIVVFHSLLGGINSNLFAQRYNTDGLAQWTDPVQLSDKATAYNRIYNGVQDGDVVYMGYFAASGVRFDSFLQRINPDGTLPWGINGADFDTNETDYEMETKIAFASGSQFIWAVCTYRDNTQSMIGEKIQKFNKETGAPQFTDTAKELFPIGSETKHSGSLQLLNDQPYFLLKDGLDNGVNPVTLLGTFLDENGDFVWPEETRPVATFAASKSRVQFTRPANGQSVAVFIEDKGAGPRIYAQNLVEETLAIDEHTNISFNYTNPVKEMVSIESDAIIQNVSVYNMLGQQLFYQTNIMTRQINISAAAWQTGTYFVAIQTTEGSQTIKLVKL